MGLTTTDSDNEAVSIVDGERVYPCHCGEMHRGEYAREDYIDCNCPHDGDLWAIGKHLAACSICGATWRVIPSEEYNIMDDVKKEALHVLWVVAATVFVALAAEMAGIKTFDDVSWPVLAVLAVRTAAQVLVGLLSKYVFTGGQ